MKKIKLILVILMTNCFAFGQNKDEAEKLVNEGIEYHDKGEYDAAVAKYDKALAVDKDNLSALVEKAMTLHSLKKYDEVISICKKAIDKHPKEKNVKHAYVSYGNALDAQKKPKKSIELYEQGIKEFPEYYELHFNKGITLAGMQKNDEALLCFEKATSLNPRHAGSHNGIAKLTSAKNMKIPALMAHYRFLAQEPQGKRAEANLYFLQKILAGDSKKTGENSITLNISADLVKDKKGKIAENDFVTVELILALESAFDYDDKNAKETEIARLMRKTEKFCAALQEGKKDGKGFYWENYAPYFIALNEKNLIETFAYIALASTDKPEVADWLDTHKAEIEKFYEWNKAVGKK